jgi:transposase-like protein
LTEVSYYKDGQIYYKRGYKLKNGDRAYEDEHQKHITELYLNGMSFGKIGKLLKISRQAAHRAYHTFMNKGC